MHDLDRILKLLQKQKRPPSLYGHGWKDKFKKVVLSSDGEPSRELENVSNDLINNTFEILYAEAVDYRPITAKSLGWSSNELYLNAFCHIDEIIKCFKVSRIDEMINSNTGEIIDNAQGYLLKLSGTDPEAELLEKAICGLNILAAFAVCDGHFHNAEKQVMMNFVDEHNLDNPNIDYGIIEIFISALYPDLDDFDKLINRLHFQKKEEKDLILKYIPKVIDADGILCDEEADLYKEIQKYKENNKAHIAGKLN